MVLLFDIVIIEFVAALRAELGGIRRIFRLPTAFIAAVQRCFCGLLGAAFRAELALIHRAAGAGPTFRLLRLRLTALSAELAIIAFGATGTVPTSRRGLGCGLGLTTFVAELASVTLSAALAIPSSCHRRSLLLLVLGLLPHLE